MRDDPDALVVLYACDSESQAVWLVGILHDEGIDALNASSNYAKNLWYETVALNQPHRVMVRRADFDRAREIAAGVMNLAGEEGFDWDKIDVGEPEDATAAKIAGMPDEVFLEPEEDSPDGSVPETAELEPTFSVYESGGMAHPRARRSLGQGGMWNKRLAVKGVIASFLVVPLLGALLAFVGVVGQLVINAINPVPYRSVHIVHVGDPPYFDTSGGNQTVIQVNTPVTLSADEATTAEMSVVSRLFSPTVEIEDFEPPRPLLSELRQQAELPADQKKLYRVRLPTGRSEGFAYTMSGIGVLSVYVLTPLGMLIFGVMFVSARD